MNNALEKRILGKNAPIFGEVPAIALVNPKFARNVGAVIRVAACFGMKQVWFSGNRINLDPTGKERIPREERMKGYANVQLCQHDLFYDQFPKDTVPVAVELKDGAEQLHDFEHPDNALYVFGPEDGSLKRDDLVRCHRRVVIPTRHCLNLATAVSIVMYDRILKRHMSGSEIIPSQNELLKNDRACLRDLVDADDESTIG
jgi:tRNA(Leu) C34 or U34 (ribose-2'-O)-methylase TrmL